MPLARSRRTRRAASHTETLLRQAEVARAAGRDQLADNLERAAELTAVPEDELLAVYTSLRPGRSTVADLERWAARLDDSKRRGRPPSSARRRPSTTGGLSTGTPRDGRALGAFRRQEQRASCVARLVAPWAELGLVALEGPNDPEPRLVIHDSNGDASRRSRRAGVRRHRPLPGRARPRPLGRRGGDGAAGRRDRPAARRRRRATRGADPTRPRR